MSTSEQESEYNAYTQNEMIKAKLQDGIYKLSDKRGRSKVWNSFSRIKNENGEELPHAVACKKCKNVYKFLKSTSNLVRHRCYFEMNMKNRETEIVDVDEATKRNCADLITEWIINNCRPINISEDSGMKLLAQFLITVGAKYGANVDIDELLPHPSTISNNISILYDLHFGHIKSEILQIKNIGYALSTDIWSDEFLCTTYMAVTIHYINEAQIVTRLLAVRAIKCCNPTSLKIKETIAEVLKQFDLELEVDNPYIVTNNLSIVKTAVEAHNYIPCANNLLNNVIEKTVQNVPELAELVTNCDDLLEYAKDKDINFCTPIALENYCPTRWSTYYLFDSIESNWTDLSHILDNKFQNININLQEISAINKLLAEFEKSSKKLENNKNPTIHSVIPHIHRLEKMCNNYDDDSDILKKIKINVKNFIQSDILPNLTITHKTALFLYPPANKLKLFTAAEKEQTINNCKSIMKKFLEQAESVDIKPELIIPADDYDDVFADFVQPIQGNLTEDQINAEIQAYMSIILKSGEFYNHLLWWEDNKVHYPLLYKTSCKVLATPACNAAAERSLANARNLITDKQFWMENIDVMVHQTTFLHENAETIN